MRKPRVFLSHSKQDKSIIEKLANDLRRARIDVWYDEWEIPPGEPFRKKIFEDGIPNCDMFFVYLTENSKNSVWVNRELDAAYIHDIDRKGGFLTIFVDSELTRNSLALDIRALHSPLLNETVYYDALMNIISKTWESTVINLLNDSQLSYSLDKLALEKQILELENKLFKSNYTKKQHDIESTLRNLEKNNFKANDVSFSLKDILLRTSSSLAIGTSYFQYYKKIEFVFQIPKTPGSELIDTTDVLGKLTLLDIILREPPISNYDENYILTDFGKEIINHLLESEN